MIGDVVKELKPALEESALWFFETGKNDAGSHLWRKTVIQLPNKKCNEWGDNAEVVEDCMRK